MSPTFRALLVVPALLCASAALADDGKVYPGVSCTPVGESVVDVLHLVGPGIRNFTESQVTVYCPVIKDVVYSTDGISRGWMWLTTENDESVFADFWSRSQFGSNYALASGSGSGAGDLTVSFGPVDSLASGIFFLRVQIPPGATLHGYRFDEN